MKAQKEKTPHSSPMQMALTTKLQNWIQKEIHNIPSLKCLEVLPEFYIGGRSIDILIKGSDKFKPIACEVDSHFHFCSNDLTIE
jgi:hypothetical protein